MNRREFLAIAMSPLAEAKPRPRITDVRVRKLKLIREVGTVEPAWALGTRFGFQVGGGSMTEIHTDQGHVGIGPGVAPHRLPAVKEQLVGQDPFEIDRLMERVLFYCYAGVQGVEIALWDLVGKICGQPLYKLWGGTEEKVTAYASMVRLSTPEERARMAENLLAEGWRAIKLRLHHDTVREDVRTVEAVRKAVGDRMAIMTDANQDQTESPWQPGAIWNYRRALDTALELERLQCLWLEEPLHRTRLDKVAELARRVDLPMAGGEHFRGVHVFRRLLQDGVFDILQPDCVIADGISQVRKVASMAETFGKQMIPHVGGKNFGVIAHLHIVASTPHAPYIEILHDPPVGDYRHGFAIFEDPPLVGADGCMKLPEGPGLGVAVKPEFLA